MKKQFILTIASLVVASSASAVLPGGGAKHGPGQAKSAHEQEIERLRNGQGAKKGDATGNSRVATEHLSRATAAKARLSIEGNGLETLLSKDTEIVTEAKLESKTNKGEQVGTDSVTVNTKKFAEEILAKLDAIEKGTMKVDPVQKAGYEALLKLLAFGGTISLTDGPGESGVAEQTREAVKFLRVMKDTIEMKSPDTTKEDIQSYVTVAENAIKGLPPGQVLPIHQVYKRIGKNAMERNANCLE